MTALALALAATAIQLPQLDEASFDRWKSFIQPKPAELAFEDRDWKPTFWTAVIEAQENQKPILLWAMNGHPMACT